MILVDNSILLTNSEFMTQKSYIVTYFIRKFALGLK